MTRRPVGRHQEPRGARADERGMALVIVVAVVSLLTIIVIEFTYNVQLDAHRVRNSLRGLQAELMVRSGINLAEGFIALDEDTDVDTNVDEWLYLLSRFCSEQMIADQSFATRLKCDVRDESGKININLTRDPRGRRPVPGEPTQTTILRDAMRCMFEGRGIDVEIVDRLAEYWQREPVELADGTQRDVPIFRSLEDFAATFGISTSHIPDLRQFLTAFPRSRMPGININTAPEQVLIAVLTADADTPCTSIPEVAEIRERQLDPENPIRRADIRALMPQDDNVQLRTNLFVTRSNIYRLEASAITNFDPEDEERGGIGKTLSEVIYRQCDEAEAGQCRHWTLKPIDWQKEGGARLFREADHLAELEELYGGMDSTDIGELFNR